MDRSTFITQLHARVELPAAALNDLVRDATGSAIAESERIVRGDEYEVHRVVSAGGDEVFVRACFPGTEPGKAAREAEAMQIARAAGVPVPPVLLVRTVPTDQGDRPAMVIGAAPGTQLSRLDLSDIETATVMQDLGHLLGRLSTTRLPGPGRPDEDGRWPEPNADYQRYLRAVRADSQRLAPAGITPAEVEVIARRLDELASVPITDQPILSHGDIWAEHLFIDADRRITGLIDWGMWAGGSPAEDLAALSHRLSDAEFAIVLEHHPLGHDAALRRRIAAASLTRSIGGLAWLVRSGQTGRECGRMVAAIRRAVADLRP
ncbi:MAG TPA: aminoglycoside phosphotransferase family protein [Mycobacteriales bacterium]|nr:aminoglycoside phosphotransferase family protein [Mycobacteriales bacterium]